MRRVRLVLLAALLAVAGCRERRGPGDGAPIVDPGPLPAYRAVAAGYNARLTNLERFTTYTSVRFWVTDEQGQERTEALDARLQVVLPSRLSLRLDKVNNTYALLGSNDERYWWIELGDAPRALWGSHALFDPARLSEINGAGGLPVHPLDVIDLLGITPLPAGSGGIGVGEGTAIAWSPDGRSVLVTAPSHGGQRRLWLDPATFAPSRIELLGGEGADGPEVIASSELSRYIPVEVRMNLERPLIASLIRLDLPEARVEMRLSSPKNVGGGPDPRVFDLDYLLKQYRVREVRSLDGPGS
jgi:hypothetical protein